MPDVLRATRKWIDSIVIGLELCPFAAPVVEAGRLRLVASEARGAEGLLADLDAELARLLRSPVDEHETTVLVHPHALCDFEDYNAFLDLAEALLEDRGCEGVVQIASFHPRYRFEGEAEDDAANWTNRAPFPMLHLLRESSVEEAIAAFGDTSSIPLRNAARLRALGPERVRARLASCLEDEEPVGTQTATTSRTRERR